MYLRCFLPSRIDAEPCHVSMARRRPPRRRMSGPHVATALEPTKLPTSIAKRSGCTAVSCASMADASRDAEDV